MIQKKLRNNFYAETLNEEILGLFLVYRTMGAISTRKTNGRSTEGVPKKSDLNTLLFPTSKIFFNHQCETFVENEIEAKYTEISVID